MEQKKGGSRWPTGASIVTSLGGPNVGKKRSNRRLSQYEQRDWKLHHPRHATLRASAKLGAGTHFCVPSPFPDGAESLCFFCRYFPMVSGHARAADQLQVGLIDPLAPPIEKSRCGTGNIPPVFQPIMKMTSACLLTRSKSSSPMFLPASCAGKNTLFYFCYSWPFPSFFYFSQAILTFLPVIIWVFRLWRCITQAGK